MNVLIIGNGFDLAHGLPTRYTDFINSAEKFFAYKQKNSENTAFGEFFIDALKRNNYLYDEFCSFGGNVWLSYLLLRQSENHKIGDKWIDFEREIREVIEEIEVDYLHNGRRDDRLFDKKGKHILEFKYKIISKYSMESKPWEKASEFLFEELMKFTRAFEIYCVCIINSKVSTCLPEVKMYKQYMRSESELFDRIRENNILEVPLNQRHLKLNERYPEFDGVLTFNYTRTFEILYGCREICYIHGEAQIHADRTNMIFGINETLNKDREDKEFMFSKFKKYFQRITNMTGSEYKDWVKEMRKGTHKHEVYIIGHSLDSTDHEILKEFFDICPDSCGVRITVFYHDELSKIKMIENTINMIGKDELIRRVHGSDWSIRFVDQYDKNQGMLKRINELEHPICEGLCGMFDLPACKSCKNNREALR